MTDFIIVYITATDADQARRIGRALIDDRLAACVNIIGGMQSIYRWDGRIVEDAEAVLIAKTRARLFDALAAKTKQLHTYGTPCIVAYPILNGAPEYLDWLAAQTAPVAASTIEAPRPRGEGQ